MAQPRFSGGQPIDSLYRISSLVGQIEDPAQALRAILDEIVSVFGANSASVSLLHPETRELRIEAASGLPEEYQRMRLKPGEGVTGWVVLHGQPLFVNDTTRDRRYVPLRPGIRSELAVPMEDRGQVIGVVNVDSERPDNFSSGDVKLLTLLTREATRSVSQIWTMRHLRTKADQFSRLADLGNQIVAKRDLRNVVDLIVNAGRDLAGCRLASFYLLDPKENRLVLESVVGDGIDATETHAESLDPRESTIGTSIRHGKQVEVLDLARTEEHLLVPLVQRFHLVSMLATPLRYENEGIGVLCAYTDHPHRFNNDERQLFNALASLGAVAIENTRLYRRIFETEENVYRNDKLTTLGLLSAEIAHEIRNPLTVLQLLFNSLESDLPEGDERKEDLGVIKEKIRHLEEIVSRVLYFGKSGLGIQTQRDFHALARETFQLVRLKFNQQGVTLDFRPRAENAAIQCDKGQIQQVLLNLLFNAAEAMPRGGCVRIETFDDPCRRIRIRVSDEGGGVPVGLRDQIFESFLTGRSEGTGLGLAIVKRIVRSHRGDIRLVESGDAGTTFEFWLPLADAAKGGREPSGSEP